MSEQEPQPAPSEEVVIQGMERQFQDLNNLDYLIDHPNAVQDPAKAEVMARASAPQEEQVVDARAKVDEATLNLGKKRSVLSHMFGVSRDADLRNAEMNQYHARWKADEVAGKAGRAHEKLNKNNV